ncbi:MAG: GGDEF domain-containing protein [Gammaproteobacteria bacterium]
MNKPAHIDVPPVRHRDRPFSVALFVLAIVALCWTIARTGPPIARDDLDLAFLFLAFGLFTITMGYPHPSYGHVSFDRVAQVACILVMGPVAAALINGLASLIYPWHRMVRGASFSAALMASLNNAGMMTLMILGCGYAYTALGGPVPLTRLDLHSSGLLLLLMLSMQLVNDVVMLAFVYLRGGDPGKHFNLFSTAVELSSVLIAVLVAIVFNRMEPQIMLLLLVVLSLGMLVLKQFANMRHQLEVLVEERTRELHEKSLELERQATHDKLTGLYNRRFADDFLEQAMRDVKEHGHDFTIALADIDYFKQVNDQHSHAKGDAVLKRVALLLSDHCRPTDMIARYGGEEFLLCFPATDSTTAMRVCEGLRHRIEKEDWSFVAPGLSITLSFGLAESFADFRRKTILSAADSRLYEAKHSGRNRVVA